MSTKKCPYCAEEILAEAKICKHCGKSVATSPLSVGAKQWIHANHIVGSMVLYAFLVGAVGALIAEYTAIAGGLAAIAPPWSDARNEVAKMYALFGGLIGLFIVGPMVAKSTAQRQIAKREGQEIP